MKNHVSGEKLVQLLLVSAQVKLCFRHFKVNLYRG